MPDYNHVSEEVVASQAEIEPLVHLYQNLQDSFTTGQSRLFKSRIAGLRSLQKLVSENYEAIAEALRSDLNQADPTPHLQEVLRETQFMISHLSDLMKPRHVSSQLSVVNFPGSAELVPDPLGVILIIGTWNYPFHSALGPLAGAIAAGNVVLVKPGSLCRSSSRLMADLIGRYFSPSAVACVEGGKEVLQPLLAMRWDHIMFTGSPNMGKIVMSAAARHLTSVTLELGGKNPVIVDESADVDLAARRIGWSKFASNAGQVSISCDHLFVHEDVADKFLSGISGYLTSFFPNGPENDEHYCRIVSKTHTERLRKIISMDKPFVAVGGDSDVIAKYISPTIIDFKSDWEAFKSSCAMEGEIFGPILPIIRFKAIEEVESFLKARMRRESPLAFYVFSSDSRRAIHNRWVSADYPAGAVVVNDCAMHIVEECLPFGGVGTSGVGSYHGKKSFEIFTHLKPVLFKTGWLDFPMRYYPSSKFNQRVVQFLLWMGRRNITPINVGKFVLVVALIYRILKK